MKVIKRGTIVKCDGIGVAIVLYQFANGDLHVKLIPDKGYTTRLNRENIRVLVKAKHV